MASAFLSFPPQPSRRPAVVSTWLPVALFACIFAVESTAALGSDHTSAPLHHLLHLALGTSLSTAIDPHWSFLHHLIRKAGHFTAYGIFSLVCYRACSLTLIRRFPLLLNKFSCHGLALAAAATIASADELHQTFLPNRTGSLHDVLLDLAGAAAFQAALWIILLELRARSLAPAKQSIAYVE